MIPSCALWCIRNTCPKGVDTYNPARGLEEEVGGHEKFCFHFGGPRNYFQEIWGVMKFFFEIFLQCFFVVV